MIKRLPFFYLLIGLFMLSYIQSKPLLNVDLVFDPEDDIEDIEIWNIVLFTKLRIRVEKFTDVRNKKYLIGKNLEDDEPKLVTTVTDVAEWCTDNFKMILTTLGLKIVEDNPDIIITAVIQKFYTLEESTYGADVILRYKVKDRYGQIIWEESIIGEANTWEDSYDLDVYIELLSDAFLEAAHRLLENKSLEAILKKYVAQKKSVTGGIKKGFIAKFNGNSNFIEKKQKAKSTAANKSPDLKNNKKEYKKPQLVFIRGIGNADKSVDIYIDSYFRSSISKDSFTFINITPGLHYLTFVLEDSYRTVKLPFQENKVYYFEIFIMEIMNNKFGTYKDISEKDAEKLISENNLHFFSHNKSESTKRIDTDKWENVKKEADENFLK